MRVSGRLNHWLLTGLVHRGSLHNLRARSENDPERDQASLHGRHWQPQSDQDGGIPPQRRRLLPLSSWGLWLWGGEMRYCSSGELIGLPPPCLLCYTIRMYSWLKSDGSVLHADTIKEFCAISGFRPSMARTLACAVRARLRGFCSTHPRAKRFRDRFTTPLINIWTGARKILGPSVKKFAKDNGISLSECSLLINRKSLCVRGWMLERSWKAANFHTADSIN